MRPPRSYSPGPATTTPAGCWRAFPAGRHFPGLHFVTADPLAPLMELPGVAAASDQAREALGRAHRHPANLRGWPVSAAEAALRAARASSVLDGGHSILGEQLDETLRDWGTSDPVFAGALRVA